MTIDEAYAFCRGIAHKHGANFSVGFRFLPRTKRRAVYAAYAYCRWADDIADESDPVILSREDGEGPVTKLPTGPSPSSRLRMTGLDDWQRELDACYADEPAHPITIALADALKHFAIPKSAFDARFPVLLMGGVYATVLGKLKKDPLTAIRKRLSLSTLQKMLVVGTRVLRPHFV